MRTDDAAHRSSIAGELFAERHVHVRSRSDSHYVVLSKRLQIGVALGCALIIGALAFAAYRAIDSHLQTVEQRREIARLEHLNATLWTTAGAAREDSAAPAGAAGHPHRLTVGLARAEAEREQARRSVEAIATPPEEGDDGAAGDALAAAKAPGPQEEVQKLRTDLVSAKAQIASLAAALEGTERELEAMRARAHADAPGSKDGSDLARLRAQLIRANQRIEELEGAIDPALVPIAPPPSPPAPR